MPTMVGRIRKLQVLWPIIRLCAVDVMDRFFVGKKSAETGLHHKAMLEDVAAVVVRMVGRVLGDVAQIRNVSPALPAAMVRASSSEQVMATNVTKWKALVDAALASGVRRNRSWRTAAALAQAIGIGWWVLSAQIVHSTRFGALEMVVVNEALA
jgi:hypothetical protein